MGDRTTSANSHSPRSERAVEPTQEYLKSLTPMDKAEKQRVWMAHCVKAAKDFVYFTTFMAGFQGLHDGQLAIVREMEAEDYGVLAASNGWGKTLFYALLTLWASFGKHYAPSGWSQWRGAIVGHEMAQALISHAEIELIRQSKHDGQRWCNHPVPCEKGLACPDATRHPFRLERWLKPVKIQPNDHVAYEWTHNGSMIHFESMKNNPTPGAAIEGWKLNLVIFDEARLEPHLGHIVEQVFLARAVRAPGMKILLASTPLATNYELLGYFEKGKKRVGSWWSRSGSIRENHFLTKAQVDKVAANIDPRVAPQVLEGQWVEPPDAFFVGERVEACFDQGAPVQMFPNWDGLLRLGGFYVGGLDLATSEGAVADWSVFTIWDCAWEREHPFRCIFEYVFPKGSSTTKVLSYVDVIRSYFAAVVGYDGNGPLGTEFRHNTKGYDESSYIPIRFKDKGVAQEDKNTYAKSEVVGNIRYFINNRLVGWPNVPELKAQILNWKLDDRKLVTDRFMAQVYAAWMAKDYMSLAPATMQFKEGGNPYQGVHKGSPFGKSVRPEWESKTPLQRKLLEAAENTRAIEERVARREQR